MKGLSKVIWDLNLNLKNIQPPKVLWICKKGWRAKTKRRIWFHAFLRFRDREEAAMAIAVLDGIDIKFGSENNNGGDCSKGGEYRLKKNARSKGKHLPDVAATRLVERTRTPWKKEFITHGFEK